MPTTTYRSDDDNLYSWDLIVTDFDDFGTMIRQQVRYDSGVIFDKTYDGGMLVTDFRYDSVQNPGTNSWELLELYYDAFTGNLDFERTVYDDGVVREEFYFDGNLEKIDQFDTGNAHDWEAQTSYYEPSGDLAYYTALFDDGRILERFYQFGALEREVQTDQTPTGDPAGQGWQSIETYFEPTGELAYRHTINDNGTDKQEQYYLGTLERIVLTDNSADGGAAVWSSIETFFEPDGTRAYQNFQRDNGVTKESFFSQGALDRVIQTDTLDVKGWATIESYYDTFAGGLAFKSTVKDNGITSDLYFENGLRSAQIMTDTIDFTGWDIRTTAYDQAGTRAATETIFDTGDRRVVVFEADGKTRDVLLDEDLDGSHSWAVRAVEYDANGQNPQITTYDDMADVPQLYLDYLSFTLVL